MAEEDNSYGKSKKGTRRKAAAKGHLEYMGDRSQKGLSRWRTDGAVKSEKYFEHKNASEPQTWHVRFITFLSLV